MENRAGGDSEGSRRGAEERKRRGGYKYTGSARVLVCRKKRRSTR